MTTKTKPTDATPEWYSEETKKRRHRERLKQSEKKKNQKKEKKLKIPWKEHYENPDVKKIIQEHSYESIEGPNPMSSEQISRAGNGDFSHWYKKTQAIDGEITDSKNIKYKTEKRLCFLADAKDYDYITSRYRTLYWTLNFFSSHTTHRSIPLSGKDEHGNKLSIGSFKDTISYDLGCDIDSKGDINKLEVREAVEAFAQFIVNELKKYCPDSVYCCFSGGGIYVYIHHSIFTHNAQYNKDREYNWKILTSCFNIYIKKIQAQFYEKYPQYKQYTKVDALNHKKRLFKTILSVHLKYPYVVIPLDPDNVKINLEKATLPISEATIEECKNWGTNFNKSERLQLVTKLKEFVTEIKPYREDDGTQSVVQKIENKTSEKYFPPCIRNVLALQKDENKNKIHGASRVKAFITTFLYQVGYDKKKTKGYFDKVSRNVGGPDTNIFESHWGYMKCPHCTTINKTGSDFPSQMMGELKICKPDSICKKIKKYGGPIDYIKEVQKHVIVEEELDKLEYEQQKETAKGEIVAYDNSFIGRYCYFQNLVTNAPFQFSQHLIIAILGHIMGRDTVNKIQPKAVHHNSYLLLIGPSGKARKSTAQDGARNIYVQETELPDGFSPEGLLKAMAEKPKGIIWPAEISELLRGIIQGGPKATFKEIANAMHGCPYAYKKQLARDKDSYVVPFPYLSAISTCTEEGLFPCMTPDLIHGGFLARWIMSYGVSKYRKRCKIPDEADKMESEFRTAFRTLYNIFENQHIIFELTDNGYDALDIIARDLEENPYWNGVEPFVARYTEYIVAYADILRFSDLLGDYGIGEIPRLAYLSYLTHLTRVARTTSIHNIVCVKDAKDDKYAKYAKYVKDDVSDPSSTLIIPIDSSYIQRAWNIIEPCLEYTRKFVKYVDEDFNLAKLEHVLTTHCPVSRSRAMQYSHLKKKDFDECIDTLEDRETVFEISIFQKIGNQEYTKTVYCLRKHIDTKKCKKCVFKCTVDKRTPHLTKLLLEESSKQQKPEIANSSPPPIYLESDETKQKQKALDQARNMERIREYVGTGLVTKIGLLAFMKNKLNKREPEKYLGILIEKGILFGNGEKIGFT